MSSVLRGLSTKTRQRERRAPFTSKEGFSVVAPMSMMLPLFHEGQEGVLLGAVEAVDFVHEDDGSGTVASVVLRLLHDGAYVFDGARDSGERDERRFCVRGDDVRQRRFPHARRPPENHGGQMVAFDEAAQYLPRPHKMPLSGVLVECAGPEACRQGL